VHGILVVDKPAGPTSHDVVAMARRALGTRAVGHAGTLDPSATGVLVLAVGGGTKLVPYLTADDKEYEASIALGAETDSLDAMGRILREVPVPELDREEVENALRTFVGTLQQRPPRVSAIKVDGVPMHARVRRGEAVEPPEREVTVHEAGVRAFDGRRIDLHLRVSKGFYVRSLARDLAQVLGTVGHLASLRRTRSGAFSLDGALDGRVLLAKPTEASRDLVRSRLVPVESGCVGLPRLVLDAEGVLRARHGKPIPVDPSVAVEGAPIALFAPSGALVAIAAREADALRVRRGFPELSTEG
jgi:tRNA pseudouridine55 synthase